MSQAGKIQVFTGDGKDETTAVIGLACRAICRGAKDLLVRFPEADDTIRILKGLSGRDTRDSQFQWNASTPDITCLNEHWYNTDMCY